MSCCWIGRGGNFVRTSAGRFRITWPQSWTGWGSIDRIGWKRCAASADYSSRRRVDRARSSMPQRAARGAGSRARRRLEPPLCRPLARRRAVRRHLHYAFLKGRGHLAHSTRCPDRLDIDRRPVQLLTSSEHEQKPPSSRFGRPQTASRLRDWMRRSTAPAGDFLGLWIPRLDAEVDCSCRRLHGCLDSSGFRDWMRRSTAPAGDFMGVWIPID